MYKSAAIVQDEQWVLMILFYEVGKGAEGKTFY